MAAQPAWSGPGSGGRRPPAKRYARGPHAGELTDEAAVVRIEAVPGNQATGERVFVFGADKARVLREESLKVGDAEFPCRVVQSGSTLRWIPKEGPGADRVALKVQTGDQTSVVTELSEEEVPVKGEAKKVLGSPSGTHVQHDDSPDSPSAEDGSLAEAIEAPTLVGAARDKEASAARYREAPAV